MKLADSGSVIDVTRHEVHSLARSSSFRERTQLLRYSSSFQKETSIWKFSEKLPIWI